MITNKKRIQKPKSVSNNDSSEVSESNDNFGLIIRDEREYTVKNIGRIQRMGWLHKI